MYCENCGESMSADSNFCAQCGNRITERPIVGSYERAGTSANGSLVRLPSATVVVGAAAVIVLCVVIFLLFNRALTNYPTESAARTVFENQRREKINSGFIEILGFKKVDGQRRELHGVTFYTVEYQAEIKYPKGSKCTVQEYLFGNVGCAEMQPGEIGNLRGEITFERTENGWKGPDGKIY